MYEAQVVIINSRYQMVTKNLTAKTAAARAKKIDALDAKGTLHTVLGYRDPA